MPKLKKPTQTVENKIDIQQYCKNEALLIKQEINEHINDEFYRNRQELRYSKIGFWSILVSIFGTGFLLWFLYVIPLINSRVTEEVNKTIHKRLDEQFQQPVISKLVHSAAKENVDSIARPYIVSQLEPYKNTLEKSRIYAMQTSAIAGSKDAYDKLVNIAKTNTPLSVDAKHAIRAVTVAFNEYDHPLSPYPIYKNGKVIDIDELHSDIEEYFRLLKDPTTTKDERISLVSSSISFSNFEDKKEIIRNCKSIISTSKSLELCAATFGILRNALDNKAPFMDFDKWNSIIDKELGK